MHAYRLVLFLHLSALLGAIGTSSLAHFAEARLRAAEAIGVMRTWVGLIDTASRVFPLALLALVGTGAYLVHRSWSWSDGLVEVGLIGIVVLFVVGAGVVGARSRALKRELTGTDDGPVGEHLARLAREHVGGIASWTNTGLAIGIVFVMTSRRR